MGLEKCVAFFNILYFVAYLWWWTTTKLVRSDGCEEALHITSHCCINVLERMDLVPVLLAERCICVLLHSYNCCLQEISLRFLTLSVLALKSAKCKSFFFRKFIASFVFMLERYIETFFLEKKEKSSQKWDI